MSQSEKYLKWISAKLQTTVKNQIHTHIIKHKLGMNIQITSKNSTATPAHNLTATATMHIKVQVLKCIVNTFR
jgi:hypothetical protein